VGTIHGTTWVREESYASTAGGRADGVTGRSPEERAEGEDL